jgi:hypothetical protein
MLAPVALPAAAAAAAAWPLDMEFDVVIYGFAGCILRSEQGAVLQDRR